MTPQEDIRRISYLKSRTALGMLRLLAEREGDVHAGRTLPQTDVFKAARQRLARRSRERESA
jgi:hypothetical protein